MYGFYFIVNQLWEELLNKAKSFLISKHTVWDAFKRVKANKGAAGYDKQSIKDFEKDLKNTDLLRPVLRASYSKIFLAIIYWRQ